MRGIIVAVSPEGAIGVDGTIPWRHKGDQARFKRVTMGAAIIMGRATFESIGRALPGRRNIVISRTDVGAPGVETFRSIGDALAAIGPADAWFIGGAKIYEEAMRHADVIDVTYVPDRVTDPSAVHFPKIDEELFRPGPLLPHEDEPALTRRVYERRSDRAARP